MFYRESILNKKEEINDWLIVAEIVLMILTFISLQFFYNGLFLLVFADIFYSYANFIMLRSKNIGFFSSF